MPAASCTQLQEHNLVGREALESPRLPSAVVSALGFPALVFYPASFTRDPRDLIISFPDSILERASLGNHPGQASHCPQLPHVHLPLFPARCSPISFLTCCCRHLRCWVQAGAQHIALSLLHPPQKDILSWFPTPKLPKSGLGRGALLPGACSGSGEPRSKEGDS